MNDKGGHRAARAAKNRFGRFQDSKRSAFQAIGSGIPEMKNNEEESFLPSVKCRIRTVYYGLVNSLIH